MKRFVDSQGYEIKEGQHVAFNRSGDVIHGFVLDIQPTHIKIRCSEDCGVPVGHISRVRHGRSILILEYVDV